MGAGPVGPDLGPTTNVAPSPAGQQTVANHCDLTATWAASAPDRARAKLPVLALDRDGARDVLPGIRPPSPSQLIRRTTSYGLLVAGHIV